MAKIQKAPDVSNVKDWEELKRFVSAFLSSISDEFNGRIDFDGNIRCRIIDVSFAASNVTYQFTHGLGKIPTGFIVIDYSDVGNIYRGEGTNTEKVIFLRASNASSGKVMVF